MKFKLNLTLILIIFSGFSFAANGPSINGIWIMSVQTGAGSGNPTFNLTQEGEMITGTYTGQLGEAPVTGTIKENNVELNIKVEGMGQEMMIQYKGTLEEDGSLKGTVKLGQFGEGTFTGKKQEEKKE